MDEIKNVCSAIMKRVYKNDFLFNYWLKHLTLLGSLRKV